MTTKFCLSLLLMAGLTAMNIFASDTIHLVAVGKGLSAFEKETSKGWGVASSISLNKQDLKLLSVSGTSGGGVLHNATEGISSSKRRSSLFLPH